MIYISDINESSIQIDKLQESVGSILFEMCAGVETEYVSEGANAEYTKLFRKYHSQYAKSLSAAKKNIKAYKFSTAAAELKSAKRALDDLKKEISAVPDEENSATIGNAIAVSISVAKTSVVFLTAVAGNKLVGKALDKKYHQSQIIDAQQTKNVGTVQNLITIGVSVIATAVQVVEDLSSLKKDMEESGTKNMYKGKLLKQIDKLSESIARVEAKLH